jgi:hypothetical protein
MKIFILLLISLSLWANIGNVMALKGSAEIERSSSTLKVQNGMELLEGDMIRTAKKSRVQVMLKDETVVTIGASSSFSFEDYLFDGTKKSKVTMRANRGFFRSVTGKIGKVAPERFKVKTASATIGIRGTDFSGDISGTREVFKCYEGAIFIEFENNSQGIEAGMMIEILKDKFKKLNFEIKKIDKVTDPSDDIKTNKTKASEQTSNRDVAASSSGIVVESIDGSDIPTEVISDITQTIREEAQATQATQQDDLFPPEVADDIVETPDVEDVEQASSGGVVQTTSDAAAAAAASKGDPFTITPNADDRPEEY